MSEVNRAVILKNIHHLNNFLKVAFPEAKIIVASGGLDPIHYGHIRYLQEAAKLDTNAKLVVIINSDEWLIRKKGFAFMPWAERAEIVAGISGVDFVTLWDDGGPTVSGALEILKPQIFAKGGDRDSAEKIPEYATCKLFNCQVVMNVGGGKIQSSSELTKALIT